MIVPSEIGYEESQLLYCLTIDPTGGRKNVVEVDHVSESHMPQEALHWADEKCLGAMNVGDNLAYWYHDDAIFPELVCPDQYLVNFVQAQDLLPSHAYQLGHCLRAN